MMVETKRPKKRDHPLPLLDHVLHVLTITDTPLLVDEISELVRGMEPPKVWPRPGPFNVRVALRALLTQGLIEQVHRVRPRRDDGLPSPQDSTRYRRVR